jgi:hypothetical protein
MEARMSALRRRQARLRDALLGRPVSPPLLRTIAADGISAEARLAIYRHHVAATLTDTLRATYPVVCRLVGDGFFAYAVDRFVAEAPPTSPCLVEYGEALPAFLASFEACRTLVYLPDVARLEWAMSRAAHADDAPPLDARALAGMPADVRARLRLAFHPSVALIDSPWPIDALWRANQPDADPHETVDLDAGGARLEVRRVDDDVVFRKLDAGDYALRRALHEGRTLDAAATAALARQPDVDLAAVLTRLFHDDTLTAYTLTTEDLRCRRSR